MFENMEQDIKTIIYREFDTSLLDVDVDILNDDNTVIITMFGEAVLSITYNAEFGGFDTHLDLYGTPHDWPTDLIGIVQSIARRIKAAANNRYGKFKAIEYSYAQ